MDAARRGDQVGSCMMAYEVIDPQAITYYEPQLATYWHYDPDDPWAIRLWLRRQEHAEGAPAAWIFGRELLDEGLYLPSGGPAAGGNVRIGVDTPADADAGGVVRLDLGSPVANLSFWVPFVTTQRFLHDTYCSVPEGAENCHIDYDTGIARLIAKETGSQEH